MRIWRYKTRELKGYPIFEVFEKGTVRAESIDEALKKVNDYNKKEYKGIPLEIVEITLCHDITIE
jgi:hypothetical protein